jgi:hypothetical protein
MTDFREEVEARRNLLVSARAAVHALRSYQYGNVAPDLAKEVADSLTVDITAFEAVFGRGA